MPVKSKKKLTKNQYEILTRMDNECCYPFSHFEELGLTKKQLSTEFKILREIDLVYFERGLINEDGEVAGSGYGLQPTNDEYWKLLKDYEDKMPLTNLSPLGGGKERGKSDLSLL